MAKRNWPEHPAVGLQLGVDLGGGAMRCKIVDAKAGPMLVDRSSFDKPDADVRGTIVLRVRTPAGAERWLPPVEGEQICKWAEQERAAKETSDGQ